MLSSVGPVAQGAPEGPLMRDGIRVVREDERVDDTTIVTVGKHASDVGKGWHGCACSVLINLASHYPIS